MRLRQRQPVPPPEGAPPDGSPWTQARARLDGLPGGGLNIAHEAVDRHAAGPAGTRLALRCLRADGEVEDVSYADLASATSRFANLLASLGVERGDRIFTLLGRHRLTFVAALGALKRGAVYSPLFSAFGPAPVQERLALGDARVLVTTRALYERKVVPVRDTLPGLRHVLLVEELDAALASQPATWTIPDTRPEDLALVHFTSGTTGHPKGALHVHEAVVAHHETGRIVFDLHPEDVYWCTADPGWVTGTSYGIIAPLTNGVTCIVDEREFDARRWYRTLAEEEVNVWYTAPTAVRMLMRAGGELPAEHDLSALRHVASVGEPLAPEAVVWGAENLGHPIHDTWWQTETGGIMIANRPGAEIRPGSMGHPLPGIEAAVVRRDAEGRPVEEDGELALAGPEEDGELVLRAGWPSMFRGYLNEDERYRRAFSHGWYLTGDLARVDGDGFFWFVGRGDDVIKSAGHLIGPFEVESALLEHPAVAEAAVIGIPDPVAGQRVKAFVVPAPDVVVDDGLRRALLGFARTKLGAAVAPKEIEFRDSVPVTRSGKVMRRLLRARELGLPEGDLSTLERGA
jgi:acetyl-CoA synthetase